MKSARVRKVQQEHSFSVSLGFHMNPDVNCICGGWLGPLAIKAIETEIPSFHGRSPAIHISSLLIGLACSYEMEVKMTVASQFLTKFRQSCFAPM